MIGLRSRPRPDPLGPGQESVWDYPRPPRIEPVRTRLRVVFDGEVVADTTRGLRVLETSHPPNYYFPLGDVGAGVLQPSHGTTHCEWKGVARYFVVCGRRRREPGAAWGYGQPGAAYRALADTVAFYPARMDACYVDDEQVVPQPGGFYGGWITSAVVGPFKGEPGTAWW
jgi:uncharacterized protein (DUF427 family)